MSDKSKPMKLHAGLLSALSQQQEIWSWHAKYHPSLRDHMHALGVAAANYNSLEFVFQSLLEFYLGLEDSGASQHLFAQLNSNQKRSDILSRLIVYKERKSQNVSESVQFFLDGFDICSENRNLLMHGRIFEATTRTQLVLQKYARKDPTKLNYMHLEVQDIRRVADDFFAYESYGAQIYLWLNARHTGGKLIWVGDGSFEPAWPRRPPPPEKLSLSGHPIQPNDQSKPPI